MGLSIGMNLGSGGGLVTKSCPTLATLCPPLLFLNKFPGDVIHVV